MRGKKLISLSGRLRRHFISHRSRRRRRIPLARERSLSKSKGICLTNHSGIQCHLPYAITLNLIASLDPAMNRISREAINVTLVCFPPGTIFDLCGSYQQLQPPIAGVV